MLGSVDIIMIATHSPSAPSFNHAYGQIQASRAHFKSGQTIQDKQKAVEGFQSGITNLGSSIRHERNPKVAGELKAQLPSLQNEHNSMVNMLKQQSKIKQKENLAVNKNAQKQKSDIKPEPKVEEKGPSKDEKKAQDSIDSVIVREKPNVKWEDVAGLDQAKKTLKEAIILPIKFPEIFVGQRTPWKGILLYGPPGTGKTYLAKACATAMDKGTFFSVSSADLMCKHMGESERLIKRLFQTARNEKPSIIFIDEIDSLAGSRSEEENEVSRRVKTEFLVQMQGVGNDATGILVLGATNLPWALDPAIRRRFERRVYIPLPEFRGRLRQLSNLLTTTSHDLSEAHIEDLASRTDMYSGSDISVLVKDASFEPLRFAQSATRFVAYTSGGKEMWMPCPASENITGRRYKNCRINEVPAGLLKLQNVSYENFLCSLKKSKPSVNVNDLQKYTSWTKTFGQDG